MRFSKAAAIAGLAVGLAGLCGAQASAQQAQSQSKAPQKQEASKAKTVWTNDNLPKTPGAVSVVGNAPASADAATTTKTGDSANPPADKPSAAAPAKGAENSQKREKLQAELAEAKKLLDMSKQELDLLQRQLALDSAQLYSTPNYTNNAAGKTQLDNDAAQVAAKQSEVDQAQKKVDDLEDQLAKLQDASEKLPASQAPQPPKASQPPSS